MAGVFPVLAGLLATLVVILWAVAIRRRLTGRRRTSLPALLPWYLGGPRETRIPHPPDERRTRRGEGRD